VVLLLPLLALFTRTLATLGVGAHYRGRCPACRRPVQSTDTVSWSRGALYHVDCTRYRLGNRDKTALPWQR
jgi:hypothetical protein